MEITDVKVIPVDDEKLKAFVSIVFDDCFVISDIKIIQGNSGLFVSMPSKKRRNGTFRDIAHPLNSELLDAEGPYVVGVLNGDAAMMLIGTFFGDQIPVYAGADMPLMHEPSEYARTTYGSWWSDDPPTAPPGGFAEKTVEALGADGKRTRFPVLYTFGIEPLQQYLVEVEPGRLPRHALDQQIQDLLNARAEAAQEVARIADSVDLEGTCLGVLEEARARLAEDPA